MSLWATCENETISGLGFDDLFIIDNEVFGDVENFDVYVLKFCYYSTHDGQQSSLICRCKYGDDFCSNVRHRLMRCRASVKVD